MNIVLPFSEFIVAEPSLYVLAAPVDVGPPGAPLTVSWLPVAGATDVEVDPAVATISPAVVESALGVLPLAPSELGWLVTVPNGARIRALTLTNLTLDDGSPSSGGPAGRHLTIALVDAAGRTAAPVCAVPPVPQRGLLPPSLTGASYADNVLTLPDLTAAKLRINLVTNDFPEQYVPMAMGLESVAATAAVLPRDLKLQEPDGTTTLWAFPGEWPAQSPSATPDMRLSIRRLFQAAIKAGQPLAAVFRLSGQAGGMVYLSFAPPAGALLRAFPGSLSTVLAGDPMPLPLAGPDLADETPSQVSADLTVTYAGLRVAEDISDTRPVAGDVAGVIVGADPVMRGFPPRAFEEHPLARVGLIGRAPEDCELSVRFADASGARLGKPGVVKVSPSTVIGTAWADLPAMPDGAIAISVVATKGRFLWASGTVPLTRFVVRDPDPGSRAVTLAGVAVARINQNKQTWKLASLPPAAFRATVPALASPLFGSVVLSNLTLRYAR